MHSGLQLPELTVQKCTVLLVCAQIAYSRNDSLHTRLLAADWFPSTDIAALYFRQGGTTNHRITRSKWIEQRQKVHRVVS